MVNVPPKSSKWVDINRDIVAAETGSALTQTLPLQAIGVETLTSALGETLAPKKALNGAKRRPALASTTRRGAGVATKPRP